MCLAKIITCNAEREEHADTKSPFRGAGDVTPLSLRITFVFQKGLRQINLPRLWALDPEMF